MCCTHFLGLFVSFSTSNNYFFSQSSFFTSQIDLRAPLLTAERALCVQKGNSTASQQKTFG
jgi:hypothetical protein